MCNDLITISVHAQASYYTLVAFIFAGTRTPIFHPYLQRDNLCNKLHVPVRSYHPPSCISTPIQNFHNELWKLYENKIDQLPSSTLCASFKLEVCNLGEVGRTACLCTPSVHCLSYIRTAPHSKLT